MTARAQHPEDEALPQLAQALDEAAMAEVFAPSLRARGLLVERCRVERVKYRPQRNCSLSYRLHLRDTVTGGTMCQHVAVRLFRKGEAVRRLAHASPAAPWPGAAGPAPQHLPALDMLAWWWPHDPKLQAPAVLADAGRMRRQVLPELVALLSGGRGRCTGHQVEIAQYVPEQRLCARVELQWDGADGPAAASLYAKSSLQPDSATVHDRLRALQHSLAWQQGRLRTPKALLHQADADLHWQRAVPGQALLDHPEAMARLAQPLGTQLAALHATPLPGLPLSDLDAWRQRLALAVEVLGMALPGSAAELRQLQRQLHDALPALAQQAPATLHGDLHPRNILVDGDRLTLIDLDGLQGGPAALELGAWIADAIYRALLDGAAPDRDRRHWQALLAGYAEAGGTLPSPRTLAWATAWNLLTQRAYRCVVNLKPGRFAIAPALLQQACTQIEELDLADIR